MRHSCPATKMLGTLEKISSYNSHSSNVADIQLYREWLCSP